MDDPGRAAPPRPPVTLRAGRSGCRVPSGRLASTDTSCGALAWPSATACATLRLCAGRPSNRSRTRPEVPVARSSTARIGMLIRQGRWSPGVGQAVRPQTELDLPPGRPRDTRTTIPAFIFETAPPLAHPRPCRPGIPICEPANQNHLPAGLRPDKTSPSRRDLVSWCSGGRCWSGGRSCPAASPYSPCPAPAHRFSAQTRLVCRSNRG